MIGLWLSVLAGKTAEPVPAIPGEVLPDEDLTTLKDEDTSNLIDEEA